MTAIPADFPWRAGMVYITPDGVRGRIVDDKDHVRPVGGVKNYRPGKTWGWPMPSGVRTDPSDPATLGAILGAVREAYGDPYGHPTWDGLRWTYSRPPTPGASGLEGMLRHIVGSGPTEFDALLAAWNARPKAST